MDGFFPYALKEKYPDGVPIKILDKTAELFNAEKQDTAPVQIKELNIPSPADSESDNTTFLRIKTESGNSVLCVKMKYSDRLIDLNKLIQPHRETTGHFVYRTNYPVRTIEPTETRTF